MSVYIAVELKRRVREHFANSCAYCRTAEAPWPNTRPTIEPAVPQ